MVVCCCCCCLRVEKEDTEAEEEAEAEACAAVAAAAAETKAARVASPMAAALGDTVGEPRICWAVGGYFVGEEEDGKVVEEAALGSPPLPP